MKKLALMSVLMLSAVALFAQADLQPLVTVKLNKSETITLKQLKDRVESYKKQTGVNSFTVAQKKEILDAMIDEKLLLQTAAKDGISVTDSQASDYFLMTMSQQLGQQVTEAQFAQIVKEQTGMSLNDYIKNQTGMSYAAYKDFIKNQLIVQQYILAKNRSDLEKISPTDSEIRAFYEMQKSSLVQSDILKLFLVIVPVENDKKAAEKKANELYNGIKNNTTTPDKLKTLRNTDTSFQAGDIYVSKTTQAAMQLGIGYDALLEMFTKSKGYISPLEATEGNYQFYIIQEKYPAKILEISDVIQPESTTTVYEYLRQALTVQKQNEYIAGAIETMTKELRVPANYQMLKTGDALDTLLAGW